MKKLVFILLAPLFGIGQNCSEIIKKTDDITGEISFKTPVTEDIRFIKMIDKSGELYFMSLSYYGKSVIADATGVILTLENGSKIEKPNQKVKCEVNSDGYIYKSFFSLSKAEKEQLSKSKLTAFKLYIFPKEVEAIMQESNLKNFNCLITAK